MGAAFMWIIGTIIIGLLAGIVAKDLGIPPLNPAEDFRRRLRVAWQASGGGVWINRYGYLGEEKLEIVRSLGG